MRVYSAENEENLRARRLLKDWAGEGLLSQEQYQLLQQETISDLRTTNIFLRLVLFVFTVIGVAAAVGLFFWAFLTRPSQQTVGIVFMLFSFACYAAAEAAVHLERLYRYGVEEALAVCSVGFLCWGLESALFSGYSYPPKQHMAEWLVPAAGAAFALWIWRRFGLWYAFLGAMAFINSLPRYWTPSHAGQHVIVVGLYAIGLAVIVAIRSGHRFDYLRNAYSLAEAFLWFGIYMALNLKASALDLPWQWWVSRPQTDPEFGRPFYWTTWVLIWCVPPFVLARGVRQKDRFVIAAGAISAVLTFVSNKSYLGWPRHTWDPMLLGIFLTGVAMFLRRWLAAGPEGVRHGFTATRLSEIDKHRMTAGQAVLGLVSPHSFTPEPQTTAPDFEFGGGGSGGGGASGDF